MSSPSPDRFPFCEKKDPCVPVIPMSRAGVAAYTLLVGTCGGFPNPSDELTFFWKMDEAVLLIEASLWAGF